MRSSSECWRRRERRDKRWEKGRIIFEGAVGVEGKLKRSFGGKWGFAIRALAPELEYLNSGSVDYSL